MIAYIILMVLILVEWIFFFSKYKGWFGVPLDYAHKKKFMILVCVELICFAGIRALDVGPDMDNYLGSLRHYRSLPHNQILTAKLVPPFDYEGGYFFFTKLCAWLSMNETVFLFVVAALIYIPVCWFILQYSENPAIGILVYFTFSGYSYSLGIYRQMIALSILLVGSKFIVDRKLLLFLMTVGLAMTFHTTAIILLPFYWLYKIKLDNKIQFIFIAEVICFIFARSIIMLSVKVFPKYLSMISSQYDVQGGSYLMLIFLNFVFIAGYILEKRTENAEDENLRMSLNATVIAIFLQIIGYSMGLFGRIVPYYSIYLTILIPALLNKYSKTHKILINFVAAVVMIGMFWFFTRGTAIDPYRTVFTK